MQNYDHDNQSSSYETNDSENDKENAMMKSIQIKVKSEPHNNDYIPANSIFATSPIQKSQSQQQEFTIKQEQWPHQHSQHSQHQHQQQHQQQTQLRSSPGMPIAHMLHQQHKQSLTAQLKANPFSALHQQVCAPSIQHQISSVISMHPTASSGIQNTTVSHQQQHQKRGQGVSCHQCKSNKDPYMLLYCTSSGDLTALLTPDIGAQQAEELAERKYTVKASTDGNSQDKTKQKRRCRKKASR
jgi:hypothetical protein